MGKKPIMGIASLIVLLLTVAVAWLSFGWGEGSLAVTVDAVASAMRAVSIALGGSVIALLLSIGSLIRGESRVVALLALVLSILVGCVVAASFAAM